MAKKKTLRVLNELAIELYGPDVLVTVDNCDDLHWCEIYLNSDSSIPVIQVHDQYAVYITIALLREKKKLIKTPLENYDYINI
jgi:hypothetical protein